MQKRKTLTVKRNRILILWLVISAFLINLSILILIPFLMHPELKPFGAPLEIMVRPDQPYTPPAGYPASSLERIRNKNRIPPTLDSPKDPQHPSEKTAPQ